MLRIAEKEETVNDKEIRSNVIHALVRAAVAAELLFATHYPDRRIYDSLVALYQVKTHLNNFLCGQFEKGGNREQKS